MKKLLIIEDGNEYETFARLFLAEAYELKAAHSAKEALALLRNWQVDGFLVDLRFDRAKESSLAGDIEATATRLFGGDRSKAVTYLKDNQGTLVLAELRKAGHNERAVFVHDFAPKRLANLKKLYGDVTAVSSFDAALILRAFDKD